MCELNGSITSTNFLIYLLKISNILNPWCAIAGYRKIVRVSTLFTRRERTIWGLLQHVLLIIQSLMSWLAQPKSTFGVPCFELYFPTQSCHNYILGNSWKTSLLSSCSKAWKRWQSPFCACASNKQQLVLSSICSLSILGNDMSMDSNRLFLHGIWRPWTNTSISNVEPQAVRQTKSCRANGKAKITPSSAR